MRLCRVNLRMLKRYKKDNKKAKNITVSGFRNTTADIQSIFLFIVLWKRIVLKQRQDRKSYGVDKENINHKCTNIHEPSEMREPTHRRVVIEYSSISFNPARLLKKVHSWTPAIPPINKREKRTAKEFSKTGPNFYDKIQTLAWVNAKPFLVDRCICSVILQMFECNIVTIK